MPGSSSCCVPRPCTPPVRPTLTRCGCSRCGLPGMGTLGHRLVGHFEAGLPRPTSSRAYASPAALPPPSQGSLPAWRATPWPDGLRTRWTTYRISCLSHRSLLSDQPCLVAAHPSLPHRNGSESGGRSDTTDEAQGLIPAPHNDRTRLPHACRSFPPFRWGKAGIGGQRGPTERSDQYAQHSIFASNQQGLQMASPIRVVGPLQLRVVDEAGELGHATLFSERVVAPSPTA